MMINNLSPKPTNSQNQTLADRKKLLLQDDVDFEDQILFNKINEFQEIIRNSQREESPTDKVDPVESAVTFNELGDTEQNVETNEEQPFNTNRYTRGRPSDVVNFDDKSEDKDMANKSNIDDENPLTEDAVSKPPYENSPNRNEDVNSNHNDDLYYNRDQLDRDLDDANQEIENKLDMIKQQILDLQVDQEPDYTGIVINQDYSASDYIPVPEITNNVIRVSGSIDQFLPSKAEPERRESQYKKKRLQNSENPYKREKKRWDKSNESMRNKEELKKLMKLHEQKQKFKNLKLHAAITIQRWVRGYIQRKEYAQFRNNIKKIRKLRRFLSVGYKKIKIKFIKNFLNVMKQTSKVIKKERSTILKRYLNDCATMIQRNFKGYMVRKYVVTEIIEELEAQKRAIALLKGWQMRKIVS